MYAENKHSIAIILQGIDARGKDGVVRHVFVQDRILRGYKLYSFKPPSDVEIARKLPFANSQGGHKMMSLHGEIAGCK